MEPNEIGKIYGISASTGIYLNRQPSPYENWSKYIGIPLVQHKNGCYKDQSAIMWQIDNKENGDNFTMTSILLKTQMEMYSLRTTYPSKGVML